MTWAPQYATGLELQSYMRVPPDVSDPDYDVVYVPAIEAASRAIDKSASRQFGSVTAEDRVYTAIHMKDTRRHLIAVDDFATAPVSVHADMDDSGAYATVVTDYTKIPANASQKGQPWTHLQLGLSAAITTFPERYKVNAAWGWDSVPDTIKMACLLQASRIAKRRDAPFGVAGSPELGSELRLLAKLDPDVAVMIAAYRRYW